MTNNSLHQIIEPYAPLALKYFTFLFQKIPSSKYFRCLIETEILKSVLSAHLSEKPIYFMDNKSLDTGFDPVGYWSNFQTMAVLKDGLIIEQTAKAIFLYHDDRIHPEEINALMDVLMKSASTVEDKFNFYMIKKYLPHDFELVEFKIKPTEVNVGGHYNDDFLAIHNKLIAYLGETNSNGVVLLHGRPGTGKTTYIRHLISSSKRRFIYIPNNLFTHLMDPEFISFISQYPESVIILEDCEELLRARSQQNADAGLSNLLNLGDGLIGDALKLTIICTFNCELGKIDEAMLRKGRLASKYSFEPLSIEKTNLLFKQLDIDFQSNQPMVLSDIFNYKIDNNSKEVPKKTIGF